MGSAEYKIYKALFTNYNRNVRPDTITTIDVLIALRFFTLMGLDQKEETLSFSGDFEMRWADPSLQWDPNEYDGRKYIMVPEELAWIPDITVYNSIGQQDVIKRKQRRIIISYTGVVVRSNPSLINTNCAINVTRSIRSINNIQMALFPFDTQTCYIRLSSWVYAADEITVESPDWLFNYSKPEELEYKVVLKRHASFYLHVLMLPTFIVSVLSLIGFFTPFDNEGNRTERVTLGLTTLLSLAVILNIVGDDIPKSANLPKLGSFVMAECLLCFAAVIVTVILLFIHQRVQTRRILSADLIKHHNLPATKKGITGMQSLRMPMSSDQARNEIEALLKEIVEYIELIDRRDELRLYWIKKLDVIDLFFLIIFQIINVVIFVCYIFVR